MIFFSPAAEKANPGNIIGSYAFEIEPLSYDDFYDYDLYDFPTTFLLKTSFSIYGFYLPFTRIQGVLNNPAERSNVILKNQTFNGQISTKKIVDLFSLFFSFFLFKFFLKIRVMRFTDKIIKWVLQQ